MTRRWLRLDCSCDEETGDSPRFQEPAESTDRSSRPAAVDISDDDEVFVDVTEDLDGGGAVSPLFPNYEMVAHLERLGLRLRSTWVEGLQLQTSVPGFSTLDAAAKAKICFQHFLRSDMNFSGGGVPLPNVGSVHRVDLDGPIVLQVDEIINISCPLRGRYQNASAGLKRCLKLSMTDVIQQVFGMEYRPVEELELLAPAGLKVAVSNVHIRHGLLMLVPEGLVVLGGVVDELEAARQRLVEGMRIRSGVTPSLVKRATSAAWLRNPSVTEQNGSAGTMQSVMSQTNRVTVDSDIPSTVFSLIDENAVENREHSQVGDNDRPFTCLASLSTEWATVRGHTSSVRGKVKCFLTGVKGFQYKHRASYELCVYIDDGSLISEILIHHNVVEKGIGRSPQEVTIALSSSDSRIVADMKETLKQFQPFLADFEGVMLIDINETSSPLPIALEIPPTL